MANEPIKTETDNTSFENSQNSQTKSKRKKDPRNIVTPDAFTVSNEILGRRLASPRRRGLAMLSDLFIIQLLSQMGSLMLGGAIAVLLILLGSHRKKGTVGKGIRKYAYIAAAVTMVGVIIYEIYLYQDQQEISILRDKSEVEETVTTIDSNEDLATQLEQAKERIEELEDRGNGGDWEDSVDALAESFSYSFGWAAIYFTLCLYLLNGQTIGKWICRIQVRQLDGSKIGVWAAFGRYGGYAASFVTGLSGFFQIYWDANRQGLHDKVANTVVLDLRYKKPLDIKPTVTNTGANPELSPEPSAKEHLADESQKDTSSDS